MKVLLLGKSGLLGGNFLSQFSGLVGFDLHAPGRAELDVLDFNAVGEYLAHVVPDIVINCTGYTAVDDAETHREEAFGLNAEAVGNLAKLCEGAGAVLIHFSTDYVFDGGKSDGYAEDDAPHPLNVYGESKLEGEKLIAAAMGGYYIIRTSWLYGEFGGNFVDTMLKLAEKNDELRVVGDQIGAPTYANDLVTCVIEWFLSRRDLPFGIYHLTNEGKCSWCEFAKEIFRIAGLNVKVHEVNSEAFPRPAKRPRCSVLINSRPDQKMRPWNEALKAYLGLRF